MPAGARRKSATSCSRSRTGRGISEAIPKKPCASRMRNSNAVSAPWRRSPRVAVSLCRHSMRRGGMRCGTRSRSPQIPPESRFWTPARVQYGFIDARLQWPPRSESPDVGGVMSSKKVLVSAVAAVLAISSASAFAGQDRYDDRYDGRYEQNRHDDSRYDDRYQGGAEYDYARVVDVEPLTRRIRVSEPRRECWNETRVDSGPYYNGPDRRRGVST